MKLGVYSFDFSSSEVKVSSRSCPPFEIDSGLCCNSRGFGVGECVPKDMSESESSDGVGDILPSPRRPEDPAF